jgi:hypothetical protein
MTYRLHVDRATETGSCNAKTVPTTDGTDSRFSSVYTVTCQWVSLRACIQAVESDAPSVKSDRPVTCKIASRWCCLQADSLVMKLRPNGQTRCTHDRRLLRTPTVIISRSWSDHLIAWATWRWCVSRKLSVSGHMLYGNFDFLTRNHTTHSLCANFVSSCRTANKIGKDVLHNVAQNYQRRSLKLMKLTSKWE